jgi:uncharacterized protein YbjT (DUF2867 family)
VPVRLLPRTRHSAPHAGAPGAVLVIGATGTVGSEVARQLAIAGDRPRVLVRDAGQARRRLGEVADVVLGDLDRPESLETALVGVDRVFLLSRQTLRQPDQERAVIAAAAHSHVRYVVKLSVFRADENSPLRIARQHREIERALEESGLAYTFLRPVFFMQNLFGMLRQDTIRTAAGAGRAAMVDARDIASAAAALLTGQAHHGRSYTLTGPEPLAFDEVADVLTAQTGRQIRHRTIPADAVSTGLQAVGNEPWFADDMATLHGLLEGGYEDLVTGDIEALTRRPPCTLAQFAHDFRNRFTGK